ncbi:Protein PafC [bioreactor metagenome]|uniref:Protein PafC n=1 Tax=bioreactor metagenome TaxID=1076179 RepID=A0A644YH57_9ZZZZ
MKNDRLFSVLYILLEKQSITAPELARLLEVSVRTVYRDVEALSKAGVPVFASPGKGGGISVMPGYTVDRALLTDEEQNQLLFAVESLKAADQNMAGLLQKLGSAFQKTNTNWIEVDFSRWGMRRTDNPKFEQLKNAILGKRVLHMTYCGASGGVTQRDVMPFKLVFKDKNWYLQAFCLLAQGYRLFKVSRIMVLAPTGDTFTEDFCNPPSADVGNLPESMVKGVRLKFSAGLAYRVYDEFDRDCIKPCPDGALLVSAQFPVDDWVMGYLLSFGTEVTVIEPKELKEAVSQVAKNIYEHHKS